MAVDPQALNAYLSTFGPTGPYLTGPTSYSPAVTASSNFYDSLPSPTSNSGRKKKKKDVGGILGTGGDLLNGVLYALSLPGAAVRSALKEAADWKTPLNPDPYEGQSPSFRDFLVQTFDKDKQIWGADIVAGNPEKGITRGLYTDKVREDMNPLLKIVAGLAIDIGTDPLTLLGGAGIARGGATAVAEVAAQNATRRMITAAEDFARINPGLGDDVAEAIRSAAANAGRGEEFTQVLGRAQEAARLSGHQPLIDEIERGMDVVSRAAKRGVSDLTPEELSTYLLDAEGRQVAQRGLAFKLPGADGIGLVVPGTDSPIAMRIGRGVGSARNRIVLGANRDQRLIGRLFNAERELTVAAREGDAPVAFAATVQRMVKRTALRRGSSFAHNFGVRAAEALDGASPEVRNLIPQLLEGGGRNLGVAALDVVDPAVLDDAVGRADILRSLFDDMAAEAQAAGANIRNIDDYFSRQLTPEGRQLLEELGVVTAGSGRINPMAAFETARSLTPDSNGIYRFMGEQFTAATNKEVTDAVTTIARKRMRQVADAATADEFAGFFSADLDQVMSTYIGSVSRRIAQMESATRLYGMGIGRASDDIYREAAALRAAEDAGEVLTGEQRLTVELARLRGEVRDAAAAERLAAAGNETARVDDLISAAGTLSGPPVAFETEYQAMMRAYEVLRNAGETNPAIEQALERLSLHRRTIVDLRERIDDLAGSLASAADDAERELIGADMRGAAQAIHANELEASLIVQGVPAPLPADWADLIRTNIDTIAQQTLNEVMRTVRHSIDTPQDVADILTVVHRLSDPESIAGVLKSVDAAIAFVKRYQIATPGFHVRNFIGGVWQNAALAGVKAPSWGRYGQLIRRVESGAATPAEVQLLERVRQAVGPGMIGREGRRGMGALREFGANVSPSSPLQRANPFSKDFQIIRWSQAGGERVEGYLRGVLAYDTLANGGTLDDAIRKINKFHFDYSSDSLTTFEQGLRRVMPFYTWSRFNIPLQIEMLGRQPQAYSRIAAVKAEIESLSEPDQLIPDYFAKLGPAIRLPFKTGDGGHLYFTPDLPMRDLGRIPIAGNPFARTVTEVASMVTPVAKAPVEFWAGKQFFNNIPLRDDRAAPLPRPLAQIPQLVPALRLLWGDRIQQGPDGKVYTTERNVYMLTQYVPYLGLTRRLAPQESRYKERWFASMLSIMGLGARTNTVEEQRRLMRGEQIRESNSNQASRRFTQSVRRGGG